MRNCAPEASCTPTTHWDASSKRPAANLVRQHGFRRHGRSLRLECRQNRNPAREIPHSRPDIRSGTHRAPAGGQGGVPNRPDADALLAAGDGLRTPISSVRTHCPTISGNGPSSPPIRTWVISKATYSPYFHPSTGRNSTGFHPRRKTATTSCWRKASPRRNCSTGRSAFIRLRRRGIPGRR